MDERPPDLPDYRNPPLDEVAIGVQFPPIEGMYDAHVGLFWQKVRDRYPRAESQPRLETPIESSSPVPPQLNIPFPMTTPLQGRTWLIAETDDYLLQIQNTRFTQNWRRRQTEYAHFEELWGLFETNYQTFQDLLTDEKLPSPNVQQVEITYINWITELAPSQFFKPATLATVSAYGKSYEPEHQNLSARYRLDGESDVIERLYVQCQPAIRAQDPSVEGYQFALVYRAANPNGISGDQIKSYAYVGRSVIVNAFTDLTTELGQERWERYK